MKNRGIILLIMGVLVTLSSCYYRHPDYSDNWDVTEEMQDSLRFVIHHHYTLNSNFSVVSDSMLLRKEHPLILSEVVEQDSIWVYNGSTLAVADITTIPEDSVDSVWVKVAESQEIMGWIHEKELLAEVIPDTPISKFIYMFSHWHVVLLLTIPFIVLMLYLLPRAIKKKKAFIHVNDIGSFYPILFCLLVAVSATLYGTIQGFAPETWVEYYFTPTLNPLHLPLILGIFMGSIWCIILVGIAMLDEVRRLLPVASAMTYLASVACVALICYIAFTILTIYYIGYPMLICYAVWAVYRFKQRGRLRYVCGNCGREIRSKGECPYCHAVNK